MNNELLQDTLSFVQKHTKIEITIDDFNSALISVFKTDSKFQNSNLLNGIGFAKAVRNLDLGFKNGDKHRPSVINSNSIRNDLQTLLEIYKKHNLDIPNKDNAENLFIELLYACSSQYSLKFANSFFGTPLKPATVQNTIGRDKHASKLKALLDQNRKMILWGEPGNGKTRFVKYCLTIWKITDYCYINFDNQNNMETNLHQIQYINTFDNRYFGSYHELKQERFSSSLLVIDSMYNSPTLQKDLELLSQLRINILIITRYPITASGFCLYQLPNLSDKQLLQIYCNDSKSYLSDGQSQKQLLEITGHNVLMISLIAFYIQRQKKLSGKSTSDILAVILEQLKKPDAHFGVSSDKPTHYKHAYTRKSLDIIGHIKHAYLNILDPINDADLISYMKYLSCFGNSQLPLEFLSRIIPDYNEELMRELNNLGLVSLSDNYVQLSSLMFHATFAAEIPDPKEQGFEEISQNLINFLENYDVTLSIPYLSNALLIFAHGLYKKVPFQNNPTQKKTSKKFEKWQDLLYLIYNYYNQNGDFFIARQVVSTINYPQLTNMHNFLDALLFQLGNHMQSEKFLEQMLSQIKDVESVMEQQLSQKEDMESDMEQQHNRTPDIDTTYFFVNTLDIIIGFYCNTSLNLLMKSSDDANERNDLSHYQETLLRIMQILLNKVELLERNTKLHISNEQLQYYQLCYQLITGFPDYSTSSQHNLEKQPNINSWENINYRIRATAFTLFMQCLHIYIIYCQNPAASLPPLLDTFKYMLTPAINYLLDQVHKCNLLPIHTFKLCWYSFISVSIIQNCLFSIDTSAMQSIPAIFSRDNIRDLINRSILSKEEMTKILTNIEEVISI